MASSELTADLESRLSDLRSMDRDYIEDELYSDEALVNPVYRSEVEKIIECSKS